MVDLYYMTKNYLLAIATLIGTIIGVGLFAIPYVVEQAGILTLFLYMVILGGLQYYMHLLYAEIVLSTKGNHRLPGYARVYSNRVGQVVALAVVLATAFGATIAYIIAGGIFLHGLLNPAWGGSLQFYTTLLFLLEALIVLFGMKVIAHSEFIMTGVLLALLVFISWRGWNLVDFENYEIINWSKILLPYGPIFFAVNGMVIIPEVCRLLKGEKELIKSAIRWGTFLSIIFMTIFAFIVVGITGSATTPAALIGISQVFNNGIVKLSLIFGILVVATSMLAIAQDTRAVFQRDFKIRPFVSWLLACFVPFILYLLGVHNFTKVVSLTGAIAGGILGVIVILIVLKIKKKCYQDSPIKCHLNRPGALFLSLLFLLGLFYEIWNVFFNKI